MTIGFNDVPSALRVPGVYIEFDGRLAGRAVFDAKAVIIGQRLNTGTVTEGVLSLVTGDSAGVEQMFGRGSMLAEMIKAAKKAAPYLEMWAVALNENAAGTACVRQVTITGTAATSNTRYAYVGGYRIPFAVVKGDTATAVAATLAAAINARTDIPMTAAVDGTSAFKVNLTCRWKGETGSAVDIRFAYYDSDNTNDGMTFAVAQTTAGAGNPNISTALDTLGGEWFNWLAVPYTDAANLTALETELGSRFGPLRAIGGRAFISYVGNLAATSSFGNGRNSNQVSCIPAGASPTATWLWAATQMAVSGAALSIDPSRQLRGKLLPGILAPAKADRWDDAERNTLLFDGISTYTIDAAGNVILEAVLTMYQRNNGGAADDAWLYINTPETLERIRLEQRHYFTQRYPDFKLASDNYNVPPGQPIMQPKLAKIEMLALYQGFMDRGWTEDYDSYKATLLAEINADNNNRLDVYDSPVLIKNLRIVAIHTEFR